MSGGLAFFMPLRARDERFLTLPFIFRILGMKGESPEHSSSMNRIGSYIDIIVKQLGWDEHIRDASHNNLNLLGEGFLRRESLTKKSEIATAAAIVGLGARYAGVDQKKEEIGLTEKIVNCDLCKSVHMYPQNIWAKQKRIRDELKMRIEPI